ncbi:MAG: helix-turn-helix domain-containing protein [Caldisericaceae bacterium]|nr:helix-turn-helix domain-containing protein [Caldisericaceae bacterium]
MEKLSQNKLVLNHLEEYGAIDPLTALSEYGIMRLGARIYELKKAGHKIEKEMITNPRTGKRFARYKKTVDKS